MWGQACSICNRLFFLKSDLDYHIKAEHRAEGPHKCQESGCKANYLTKASLARHMKKFHGEGARKWKTRNLMRFPGEVAQVAKSKRKQNKVENRKTVVDEVTGQKKYLCLVCGREDSNLQTHYLHMKEHRDVSCEECGRTFYGLKRLNLHKAQDHPQPKIECQFCSKMFSTKVTLTHHITRVHTPEEDRPKLCLDCGKRFAKTSDLKQHRIIVHEKTRPVLCRYGCGASYKENSSRNGHEKKQHGGLFQGGGTERHLARQQQQQQREQQQQQQQQQQRQQTKRQQRRQTQRQLQAETRAAVAAIQPQQAHQQLPVLPPQPMVQPAQPQAVYPYHQQVVQDGSIVYHFPVGQPMPGTSTGMYR